MSLAAALVEQLGVSVEFVPGNFPRPDRRYACDQCGDLVDSGESHDC